MNDGMSWSTKDECDFIDGLGAHSDSVAAANASYPSRRRVLLRQYGDAAEQRERWGAVDKEQALAYARDTLAQMNRDQ